VPKAESWRKSTANTGGDLDKLRVKTVPGGKGKGRRKEGEGGVGAKKLLQQSATQREDTLRGQIYGSGGGPESGGELGVGSGRVIVKRSPQREKGSQKGAFERGAEEGQGDQRKERGCIRDGGTYKRGNHNTGKKRKE